MLGLILETSTERSIVAAFDDRKCLFEEQLPFGLQNSHLLLPQVQEKIKDNTLKLADLSYIAVGIGPGSYTGIRVGAMIAKSLTFVFQIPLIGVCTLDAFIPDQEGSFAAVVDAKMGGVFLQTGHLANGVVTYFLKPQAYSLPEAAEIMQGIPTIVTPNAEKIRPKLEGLKPDNQWLWSEQYPKAEQLVAVAQKKMREEDFLKTDRLELLYMRKTQAEIEKES